MATEAVPTPTETPLRLVRVDVFSTSKPERGTERATYRCDAIIRVSEGDEVLESRAHLVVHHPRGWMGVRAGFTYELDPGEFPHFAARAEEACLRVMDEFPSDQIISVFLLGTGHTDA